MEEKSIVEKKKEMSNGSNAKEKREMIPESYYPIGERRDDFYCDPSSLALLGGIPPQSLLQPRYNFSAPMTKVSWRKGKWIDEEEIYTKKLIEAFNNGYLNVQSGTTLRSFLSERLSCDPMRITKKFAGSSCIGKQVFTPCSSKTDPNIISAVQAELKQLEEKFQAKISTQSSADYYPYSAQMIYAAALQQQQQQQALSSFYEGIPPELLSSILSQQAVLSQQYAQNPSMGLNSFGGYHMPELPSYPPFLGNMKTPAGSEQSGLPMLSPRNQLLPQQLYPSYNPFMNGNIPNFSPSTSSSDMGVRDSQPRHYPSIRLPKNLSDLAENNKTTKSIGRANSLSMGVTPDSSVGTMSNDPLSLPLMKKLNEIKDERMKNRGIKLEKSSLVYKRMENSLNEKVLGKRSNLEMVNGDLSLNKKKKKNDIFQMMTNQNLLLKAKNESKNIHQKDLDASDLLLNFFKTARSVNDGSSSDNTTGDNTSATSESETNEKIGQNESIQHSSSLTESDEEFNKEQDINVEILNDDQMLSTRENFLTLCSLKKQ